MPGDGKGGQQARLALTWTESVKLMDAEHSVQTSFILLLQVFKEWQGQFQSAKYLQPQKLNDSLKTTSQVSDRVRRRSKHYRSSVFWRETRGSWWWWMMSGSIKMFLIGAAWMRAQRGRRALSLTTRRLSCLHLEKTQHIHFPGK